MNTQNIQPPGKPGRKQSRSEARALAELRRHQTDEWAWRSIDRLIAKLVEGIIHGRLL